MLIRRPLDAALEVTRFILGGLLVAANVAVWYGVWLERETAPPEVQQRGWRILVRGLAAETTIGFLLFAADTSLGLRQAAKLNNAQSIAGQAQATGLTLKRLNSVLEATVTRQTAVITGAQMEGVKSGVQRVPGYPNPHSISFG